jgi:hypothetical protein
MQPSPQSASTMQVPAEMPTSTRHCDDVVYQGMTIVAILMVLASLWVF